MTTILPAAKLVQEDAKLKDVPYAKFTSLPDNAVVERAVKGLKKKNVSVQVVGDRKAALQALVALIPEGTSVMKAGSTTLVRLLLHIWIDLGSCVIHFSKKVFRLLLGLAISSV